MKFFTISLNGVSRRMDRISLFTPGIVFLTLGILALIAPKLLGAIVAALFLFLGIAFCFLTWKLLKFKQKFEEVFKGAGKQFVVRTMTVQRPGDILSPEVDLEEKKIIIH